MKKELSDAIMMTMSKKTLFPLLFLSLGLLNAGEFRIDLDSRKTDINLEIINPSGTFLIKDSPWYNEKRKQYFEVRGKVDENWKEYSFTVVPDKDGTITCCFRAPYVKKGEKMRVCAFDDVKVNGKSVKNGSFEEKIPSHGWIPSWNAKERIMNSDAADGQNYIILSYSKGALQSLPCKAGVPIKLSFMAKKAMW